MGDAPARPAPAELARENREITVASARRGLAAGWAARRGARRGFGRAAGRAVRPARAAGAAAGWADRCRMAAGGARARRYGVATALTHEKMLRRGHQGGPHHHEQGQDRKDHGVTSTATNDALYLLHSVARQVWRAPRTIGCPTGAAATRLRMRAG